MATTRIKDLSKTATTLAADSNFVLDGSTNGTQKITTGNVKADIATSFAGDLSTYGIATLGSDNKLNPDQLPDSVTNGINFVGTADSGSDLTSTTQGDFYIVNTAFTHLSISYAVGDSAVYNGSAYVKVTPGTTQIGEGGTGASTLDGAKANLEIPDVGSSPQEVSLNGMLGSMAFQSAEAVSVGTLEADGVTTLNNTGDNALRVESTNGNPMYVNVVGAAQNYLFDVRDDGTSKFRVDGSGRVGVGTASMSTYNSNANNLVVGSGSGSEGLTIASGTTGEGGIYFADGTTGNQQYRGYLGYGHTNDELFFGTDGVTKWKLNTTGNLVPQSSGLGIDFGSTNTNTGVTVDGSVMSEYESGTWTPAYSSTGTAFTTPPTMDVYNARYVRVGDLVTFYAIIRTDSVDLTGAGGYLIITGLPYAATASSGYNFAAVTVGQASFWANAPAGGYVDHGQSYIYLTKRTSSITGNLTEMTPSDLTAGTTANQNQVVIGGSYYTNA